MQQQQIQFHNCVRNCSYNKNNYKKLQETQQFQPSTLQYFGQRFYEGLAYANIGNYPRELGVAYSQ